MARSVRNRGAILVMARRFLETSGATGLVCRIRLLHDRFCLGRTYGRAIHRALRPVPRLWSRPDRGAFFRRCRGARVARVRANAAGGRAAGRCRRLHDLRMAPLDRPVGRTVRSAWIHASRYASAADRGVRGNVRNHVRALRARRIRSRCDPSPNVAAADCGCRRHARSHVRRVGVLAGAPHPRAVDRSRGGTRERSAVAQVERTAACSHALYGDDARARRARIRD